MSQQRYLVTPINVKIKGVFVTCSEDYIKKFIEDWDSSHENFKLGVTQVIDFKEVKE